MKKIILIFLTIFNLLLAKEELKFDIFVGHDFNGTMKIDRDETRDHFSNYSTNYKMILSYKVYNHMAATANIGYETYYMDTYKGSFNLIPYTLGVRYFADKRGNIMPYIALAYGASVLMNEEEFPIDTRINGFAEADFGVLYKDKYFLELAYKHHAFAYKPIWPTFSSFWNGQFLSLNFGYSIK